MTARLSGPKAASMSGVLPFLSSRASSGAPPSISAATAARWVQRAARWSGGARGHRGAGGDQRPDKPVVAPVGGQVQGGQSVLLARRGGVGAALEQQLERPGAVEQGRDQERGQTARVPPVDARALGEREIGQFHIVRLDRLEQNLLGDAVLQGRRRGGAGQQGQAETKGRQDAPDAAVDRVTRRPHDTAPRARRRT